LPQDQVFRFQRCSRLEARSQDTENQLEQIRSSNASLRRPLAASMPNRIFGTHRYRVDTTGHQFRLLVDFESHHSDVYYVAPRFSTWQAYERAFQERTVLENSLILKPSEISRGISAQGAVPGIHRVVYDSVARYVCSEAVELHEQRPQELANEIAQKVRATETSLHHQIEHLASRPVTDHGPGRIDPIRRERLYGRAKRPIDAMAAIVGIEAWSQGAQVLFVTAQ
jgi:hypothetical protein